MTRKYKRKTRKIGGVPGIELTDLKTKRIDAHAPVIDRRIILDNSKPKKTTHVLSDMFVTLCNHHIMNTRLHQIEQKTHLQHNDINIYVLKEFNNQIISNCKEPLNMLIELMNAINTVTSNASNVDVDLMLEVTQKDSLDDIQLNIPISELDSRDQVRYYFNDCMITKDCFFRVHWVNPNDPIDSKIPEWITSLHSNYGDILHYEGDIITIDESNREEMKGELFKLVTENKVIVKEIKKASNDIFNLTFIETEMHNYIDTYFSKGLHMLIFDCLSYATAFYTVARIIKSLKNVIIFTHYNTDRFLVNILQKLRYNIIAKAKRDNCMNLQALKIANDESIILPIPKSPIMYETYDKNLLGICINTHGKIRSNSGIPIKNENFPDVYITKTNLSSYGCVSFINEVITPKTINTDIDKSLKNFRFCKQEYLTKLSHIQLLNSNDLPLFDTKGSCQTFEGIKEYYEKLYEKQYIIFAIIVDGIRREINIANCTNNELYDFFTKDIRNYDITDTDIRSICDAFIIKSMLFVTTTFIFELISLAKEVFKITKVNIMDKSCSVIEPSESDTEVHDGYLIHPKHLSKEIGFGGKRKHKIIHTNLQNKIYFQ